MRTPEIRDAFEFNLSNANATDLLAALGLASCENADPYPIKALSHLVTAALRRRLGKRSPAQPAFVEQQPGKVAVIRCARREGYLEERLGDLARLIQRGRAVGATHIGWS